MKYLSLEYWKEVQKIANTDNEFGIKAKLFIATFTFKVIDMPDLPAIWVKFNGGKVEDLRALAEGEKTDFTLEGPYENWMKVNKGEVDASNAIMTRMLTFKGNQNQIMRYGKAFVRLFNLMKQTPVDY